ncbi:MAG: haloacid dehalogenase type II [Chloroflexi bacterium]|nr:haloacid dehalogenase type II [Chloroflexota bacterium]
MSLAVLPEVLTFDCYGTLIDWDAGVRAYVEPLLARKGADVDPAAFHERWEAIQFDHIQGPYRPYKTILAESLTATLAAYGLPIDPDDGPGLARAMPTWTPFPDTRPALERLKRRFRLCIISNTDNDILAESVRRIGVAFNATVTAEDSGMYKPNLASFQLALAVLKTPPERILHVAFGFKYDIGPANRLGFASCWVNRYGEPTPPGATPTAIVPNLLALADLLGV